jgi:hypothetical protein
VPPRTGANANKPIRIQEKAKDQKNPDQGKVTAKGKQQAPREQTAQEKPNTTGIQQETPCRQTGTATAAGAQKTQTQTPTIMSAILTRGAS